MRTSFKVALAAVCFSILGSAHRASAEPPACYQGFVLVRGECVLRIVGEVQRPYQFSLNDRSATGWRAAEPSRSTMRGDVVRATRAQPF